jgi:hypothetical protein
LVIARDELGDSLQYSITREGHRVRAFGNMTIQRRLGFCLFCHLQGFGILRGDCMMIYWYASIFTFVFVNLIVLSAVLT